MLQDTATSQESYERFVERVKQSREVWGLRFFFSSRSRHTSYWRDWSSDVCSSDLNMSGSGTTVIASGGSLVLSGANSKQLGQRTINNNGTTSLSGGDLWSGQGAVFNNAGTFDVAGDASFQNNLGGPATINNTGTFQKSGGTGNSEIGRASCRERPKRAAADGSAGQKQGEK